MPPNLSYPDSVIPPLRFQYCPICATGLTREVLFDDNIPRVKCPRCGWIQLLSNVVGVVVVARNEQGVAAIVDDPNTVAALQDPGGYLAIDYLDATLVPQLANLIA